MRINATTRIALLPHLPAALPNTNAPITLVTCTMIMNTINWVWSSPKRVAPMMAAKSSVIMMPLLKTRKAPRKRAKDWYLRAALKVSHNRLMEMEK